MITPRVVPATPIEDPEIKKILIIELFDAPIVLRLRYQSFVFHQHDQARYDI